ncbi:MAG: low molecular weight protein arginine phosphatase [Anaerolineae bacterium]|nr:low molecular weight protein arginine phosphatase [Anaerolineae bacterium]
MKTILFVCTANICRSPMAAAIMRRRIAELGLADQVEVLSAGVWAEEGLEASRNAVTVLGRRECDLTGHRSQQVTPALLDQANIVLVMEEAHRRSLFYMAPQHLSKVFLLAEMAGEYEEVADPYGGPIEEYEQTADLLEKLIDAGLPRILRRLSVNTSGA